MRILFLHGWHSVPGGVKPTYLIRHGHEVVNPALADDDFDEAVRTAQAESRRDHRLVRAGRRRWNSAVDGLIAVRDVGSHVLLSGR